MDLYGLDLTGITPKPLCGGNIDEEEQESCLTLAPIPGHPDAYVIGDSKNPAAGVLRFTGAELRAAGIDTSRIA